ncbi:MULTISPECIES: hypothetical protein [unclassified Micromonospora]|uniref:hypothetical protein n=1 Tax=unclassified Micromonospora TaxID=2617518 RepID=UPI0036399BBF
MLDSSNVVISTIQRLGGALSGTELPDVDVDDRAYDGYDLDEPAEVGYDRDEPPALDVVNRTLVIGFCHEEVSCRLRGDCRTRSLLAACGLRLR